MLCRFLYNNYGFKIENRHGFIKEIDIQSSSIDYFYFQDLNELSGLVFEERKNSKFEFQFFVYFKFSLVNHLNSFVQ